MRASGATAGEGVKLGILGECEGPFGGFHEDTVAGVELALANFAGATVNSTTSALDGWEGAEVNGTPIELVGIGCGDDTPDTILGEIRQLVEQEGANIVIGPLSGDEGIAVAEYAKANPDLTVLSGIAGSQEPTLQVQAANYFRFHGDGAIWNAGMGDILHNQEGWDTVAVIADDYSFGHTSAAGFIADFCGVGGDVVSRVFPPLGTTDYSSFIQQLPDPDEVDGYFWVVGGTGTQAALEAFVNAKGDLTGDQHAGNLFFNPSLAQALGTDIAGAYVGGFAVLPGDIKTPEIEEYLASADATWDTLASGISAGEAGPPSAAAGFGFMYGYYSAGVALVRALEATGGDASPEALQPALAELALTGHAVRRHQPRREPQRHRRRRSVAAGRGGRRDRPEGRRHHPWCRPELRRHLQHRHAGSEPGLPGVRGDATCRGSATRSRSWTGCRRDSTST